VENLKERLGKIIFASDTHGQPVTMDDLGITGALTALLKDAIEPTLLQTIEGTGYFFFIRFFFFFPFFFFLYFILFLFFFDLYYCNNGSILFYFFY
jgi:hypothetical protein